MSSATFAARSSGVSALTGKTFMAGEMCFYLTCQGHAAIPAKQIEASKKESGFNTGYRIVPNGSTGYGRFRKTIFVWEQNVDGRWCRVATWSNLVPVEEARALGFKVPRRTTVAQKGKRTVGVEHTVESQSDEERIAADVAEAETMLAKINAVAMDAPMLPAVSEATVSQSDKPVSIVDVVKAFAGWNVD